VSGWSRRSNGAIQPKIAQILDRTSRSGLPGRPRCRNSRYRARWLFDARHDRRAGNAEAADSVQRCSACTARQADRGAARTAAVSESEEDVTNLITMNEIDQKSMESVVTELNHASDRAAGIVGAVLVEESLTNLIRSRLNRDEEIMTELLHSSAPLGAFSTKIKVGFLLGLYSADARKELITIKDIRNQYAHYIARSFEYESIRDKTNNLKLSESTEFWFRAEEGKGLVLYIGPNSKPADFDVQPVVSKVDDPSKLKPRDRYIRACHFYNTALGFLANTERHNPAWFF
jgi:hypothetical protein